MVRLKPDPTYVWCRRPCVRRVRRRRARGAGGVLSAGPRGDSRRSDGRSARPLASPFSLGKRLIPRMVRAAAHAAALFLCASLAGAQQPPQQPARDRPPQQPQVGTAAVRGRVVDGQSGMPIASRTRSDLGHAKPGDAASVGRDRRVRRVRVHGACRAARTRFRSTNRRICLADIPKAGRRCEPVFGR